jgi:hypothetical protein
MNRGMHPKASVPSSNNANNANNDLNPRYDRSENRKHHTPSEERMVRFQKFVGRYES